MGAATGQDQKYSIQWTVVLAYGAILAVGLTGWIGVVHLATVLLK